MSGIKKALSTALTGAKSASSIDTLAAKVAARETRNKVKTRFPTLYDPVRSASNQRILIPSGLNYNPAPSTPDPYHTPAAFLPKGEQRVTARDAKPYDTKTMPLLKPNPSPSTILTEEQVNEMQELRASDPATWTIGRLAQKYEVPEYFVGYVTAPPKEFKAEIDEKLAFIKQKIWNSKRKTSRQMRARRKKFWLSDTY